METVDLVPPWNAPGEAVLFCHGVAVDCDIWSGWLPGPDRPVPHRALRSLRLRALHPSGFGPPLVLRRACGRHYGGRGRSRLRALPPRRRVARRHDLPVHGRQGAGADCERLRLLHRPLRAGDPQCRRLAGGGRGERHGALVGGDGRTPLRRRQGRRRRTAMDARGPEPHGRLFAAGCRRPADGCGAFGDLPAHRLPRVAAASRIRVRSCPWPSRRTCWGCCRMRGYRCSPAPATASRSAMLRKARGLSGNSPPPEPPSRRKACRQQGKSDCRRARRQVNMRAHSAFGSSWVSLEERGHQQNSARLEHRTLERENENP